MCSRLRCRYPIVRDHKKTNKQKSEEKQKKAVRTCSCSWFEFPKLVSIYSSEFEASIAIPSADDASFLLRFAAFGEDLPFVEAMYLRR